MRVDEVLPPPRPLLQPHPPRNGAPAAGPRISRRSSSGGGGLRRIDVAAVMAAAAEDAAFNAATSETAAAVSLAGMLPAAPHRGRWSDHGAGTAMGCTIRRPSVQDPTEDIATRFAPRGADELLSSRTGRPGCLAPDLAPLGPAGSDGGSEGRSLAPVPPLRNQEALGNRSHNTDPLPSGSAHQPPMLLPSPIPYLTPTHPTSADSGEPSSLPDSGLGRRAARISSVDGGADCLMGNRPAEDAGSRLMARRPSLSIKLDALPLLSGIPPLTPDSQTPHPTGRPTKSPAASSFTPIELQPLPKTLQPLPKTLQPLPKAVQPLPAALLPPPTPSVAQEPLRAGKRTLYRQSSSSALDVAALPPLSPLPESLAGPRASGLRPAIFAERSPSPLASVVVLKPISGRWSCPGSQGGSGH